MEDKEAEREIERRKGVCSLHKGGKEVEKDYNTLNERKVKVKGVPESKSFMA